MPAMASTQSKLARERRDILIMEMVESGANYGKIKRALATRGIHISVARIGQIVKAEYVRVREQRKDLGELVFDQKIEQLNSIIRTNAGIINAPCVKCKGDGTVDDPDRAEGNRSHVCEKCKGDGRAYSARDRKGASSEMRLAIDQQCKMLGLYAPEKFALTDSEGNDVDFLDELASADEEDLMSEVKDYLEGVEAARVEVKEKETRGA